MYPTKEQILELPRPTFPPGLLALVSIWKKKYYKNWSTKDPGKQWETLITLANLITGSYKAPQVMLSEWDDTDDKYEPKTKTITLKHSSIISLLHELAHHLFGPNELTACRWSVWLYQLRFRKDYNKLVWNGHLLTKPLQPSPSRTKQSP